MLQINSDGTVKVNMAIMVLAEGNGQIMASCNMAYETWMREHMKVRACEKAARLECADQGVLYISVTALN